jgi:hypothetical protein
MPSYMYACLCGHSEEIFHTMTSHVAIVCPTCLTDMKRKPQPTTVTFNGSGFYSKDNA